MLGFMAPLISIVTPCFNSGLHLVDLVNNVQNQTFKNYEHILIDDGSTDNTLALISELAKKYNNIRYFTQENKGAGVARNLGIEKAVGKYIFFLDSDDSWSEYKLEVQFNFMEENGVVFSFGDYVEKKPDNGFVKIHYLKNQYNYQDLLRGCPIGCLTVAFNQDSLGKRYMPKVRRGQDWALWLDITRNGTVAIKYPGVHASYNVQINSLSKNKIRKVFDIYHIYRTCERKSSLKSYYYLFRHIVYRIFLK